MAFTNFGRLPIGAATALNYKHDFGADMNRLLALKNMKMQERSQEMNEETLKLRQKEARMNEMQFEREFTDIQEPILPFYNNKFQKESSESLARMGEITATENWKMDTALSGEYEELYKKVNQSPVLFEAKTFMQEREKLIQYMNNTPGAWKNPKMKEQMDQVKNQMENGVGEGESTYVFSPSPDYDELKEIRDAVIMWEAAAPPKNQYLGGVVNVVPDYNDPKSIKALDYIAGIIYESNPEHWDQKFMDGSSSEAFRSGERYVKYIIKANAIEKARKTYQNNATNETNEPPPKSRYDEIVNGYKYAKDGIHGIPNPDTILIAPLNAEGIVIDPSELFYEKDNKGNMTSLDLNKVVPGGRWKGESGQRMIYDKDFPNNIRFAEYTVILQQSFKDDIELDKKIDDIKAEYPSLDVTRGTYKTIKKNNRPGRVDEYVDSPSIRIKVSSKDNGQRAAEYDSKFQTPGSVTEAVGKDVPSEKQLLDNWRNFNSYNRQLFEQAKNNNEIPADASYIELPYEDYLNQLRNSINQ